jgi:hypothetical protein
LTNGVGRVGGRVGIALLDFFGKRRRTGVTSGRNSEGELFGGGGGRSRKAFLHPSDARCLRGTRRTESGGRKGFGDRRERGRKTGRDVVR